MGNATWQTDNGGITEKLQYVNVILHREMISVLIAFSNGFYFPRL